MSLRNAASIARSAAADSPSAEWTCSFAQLGAKGSSPQNLERDVGRWLGAKLPIDLDVYTFKAVRVSSGLGVEKYQHACILPHELFALLSRHGDLHFLDGVPQSLADFWDMQRGEDWFESHPHLEIVKRDPTRCLPLRLHGDGCKGFEIISWMVLSRQFLGRHLFGLFHEDSYIDESMYRTLWDILAWSFEALAQGIYPQCDHEGKPWHRPEDAARASKGGAPLTPDKMRGIYCGTTGDWKWTRYTFGMEQHWQAVKKGVCHRCFVDGSAERHWTILDVLNPGFIMRRLNSDFVLSARPVFAVAGMHLSTIRVDWLHAGILGPQQFATGAALEELCREDLFGKFRQLRGWKPKMNMQLRVAQSKFKKWVKGRCTTSTWNIGMIGKTKSQTAQACMKVKGRQCVYVTQWLHSLLSASAPDDYSPAGNRCKILGAYARLFEIFSMPKWRMSSGDLLQIKELGQQLLLCSNLRATQAKRAGSSNWRLKPKHHQLLELLHETHATALSPSLWWTFGDEDFVGKVSVIASRCHRRTVSVRALQRWMIRYHVAYGHQR